MEDAIMLDFSSVRTVRVHKEQFEAIEKKANSVIITCIEDGRCISFDRRDMECKNCDYYAEYEGVCFNAESENCADFVSPNTSCEHWTKKDGDKIGDKR